MGQRHCEPERLCQPGRPIRFRYWTDGAVAGQGFAFDNLKITGLAKDGAETDAGWTFDGFNGISSTYTTSHFNAYVLENRQYIGYDYSLQSGPYNFGFPSQPNMVEHFPYQNGLLIWYWDEAFRQQRQRTSRRRSDPAD